MTNEIAHQIEDAMEAGDLKELRRLFAINPSWLHQLYGKETWLHIAATRGQLAAIKELLNLGIDVNRRGSIANCAAINLAASNGHLNIVEHLLDHGAEMDVSEPERNPLFGAIPYGHKDIVQLLLNRGIDASVVYNGDAMSNMDAIAFAKESGYREIAELIRAHLAQNTPRPKS